jgi:hypothetical protein
VALASALDSVGTPVSSGGGCDEEISRPESTEVSYLSALESDENPVSFGGSDEAMSRPESSEASPEVASGTPASTFGMPPSAQTQGPYPEPSTAQSW